MTRRNHAAPKHLSSEARDLWRRLTHDYVIDDAASLALLRQLADALDGVRACQAKIRTDGLMVLGSAGQSRPHPLLAAEAEYRRAFLACVRALKLDLATEV